MEIYFEKIDGKIIGNFKQDFINLKNGKYKITENKETRSGKQNRLYHKWITDLVACFEEKGIFITTDELHSGLRDRLIKGKYKINKFTGKRQLIRKSTAQLNKKEFSKYINDVEKYLYREFEISYPLPTDFFYVKK